MLSVVTPKLPRSIETVTCPVQVHIPLERWRGIAAQKPRQVGPKTSRGRISVFGATRGACIAMHRAGAQPQIQTLTALGTNPCTIRAA